MTKLGYDLKDARDYAVAACWEFIIPRVGGDVANIAALVKAFVDMGGHQLQLNAVNSEVMKDVSCLDGASMLARMVVSVYRVEK